MATMRAGLGTLLVAAAISGVGCGDRTGVLLEVTRDEATVPADLDRLRFFVGVEVDQRYVDDGDPAGDVAIEDGRDVLTDPYLFLLSKGDGMSTETPLVAVVVAFQGETAVGIGAVDAPFHFIDGKVLGYDVTLQSTVGGSVVITETGCLIWNDGVNEVVIGAKGDADCDGDPGSSDCDDSNPSVGHNSPEVCENGIDDDCDDMTDEIEDADGDLVNNCLDCDDADDQRFPGNLEICDGVDNDCNLVCDDGALDGDNDDFTVCDRKIFEDGTCSDPSPELNDCNDADPAVNPEATEVCNGADDDCDGICDDEFDGDGDKYTSCGSRVDVCDGTSPENIDCEPDDFDANPGVLEESCDDVDNNCDGLFYPDAAPCYEMEGDNTCLVGTRTCDDGNLGWGECMPNVNEPQQVPTGFCDAYQLCQDQPDPFACANNMAVTTTHACTVLFPLDLPSSVCPNAAALLPHSTTGDPICQWALAPVGILPRYDVVLDSTPDGIGGGPTSSLCQPFVVVRDTIPAPPVSDSWMLVQKQNGTITQAFRLLLTPQGVSQCPEVGMSCDASLPPPP